MSNTATLLVELRCEELPPALLYQLADDFGCALCGSLVHEGLLDNDIDYEKITQQDYQYHEIHGDRTTWPRAKKINSNKHDQSMLQERGFCTYATPRRLTVLVHAVRACSSAKVKEVRGPALAITYGADKAPSAALAGFLRAQGADVRELVELEYRCKTYVGLRRQLPGRQLTNAFGDVLERALKHTVAPRMMRWNNEGLRFMRPVRGICAMHGKRPLVTKAFGVQVNSKTHGHRFMQPKQFDLADFGGADAYVVTMKRHKVLVRPLDRNNKIAKEIALLEKNELADMHVLNEDKQTWIENVQMSEWPTVCKVDYSGKREHLRMYQKLVRTCVGKHLRAFAVRKKGEKSLAPHFVFIADHQLRAKGAAVPHLVGLDRVIKARLQDAHYLLEQDYATDVAQLESQLAGMTYLAGLGDLQQRGKRLAQIATQFMQQHALANSHVEDVKLAARYRQLDLATHVVSEFDNLHGDFAAHLLARANHKPTVCELVAVRVADLFLPSSGMQDNKEHSKDATKAQRSLLLADNLERLIAFVYGGKAPTGSADPYGLRTNATNVYKLLTWYAGSVPRDLNVFLRIVATVCTQAWQADLCVHVDLVRELVLDRVSQQIAEVNSVATTNSAGMPWHRLWSAVCAARDKRLDLGEMTCWTVALQRVAKKKPADIARLLAVHKRCDNISTAQDKITVTFNNTQDLPMLPAEKKLIDITDKLTKSLVQGCDEQESKKIEIYYDKALIKLLELEGHMADFFDQVRLDVDDTKLRSARLALVRDVLALFDRVCNFRRLYA